MKHLLSAFPTLLISLIILSCSSDDDNNSNPEQPTSNTFNAPTTIEGNIQENLLGTWQVISITEDDIAEVMDVCDLEETVTFGVNNQYTSIEAETNNEPCTFFTNRGTYTVDGTTVSFNLGGDRFNQTITGLNETGLVLRENFRENGRTIVFVETYRKIQ